MALEGGPELAKFVARGIGASGGAVSFFATGMGWFWFDEKRRGQPSRSAFEVPVGTGGLKRGSEC